MQNNDQKQIAGAIILAGVIIAGAILLKGDIRGIKANDPIAPAKISENDKTLGDPKAKVALIMYEDFQCPFCGAISGLVSDTDAIKYLKEKVDPNWTPFVSEIINTYVKNGEVQFVYRDWAFLGTESVQSALAARCAGDQNKFWEYHDYLYTHQNGENKGNFSDLRLKSFATDLGLDTTRFNQCLDEGKYIKMITDSRTEGTNAGVTGTPKGFILKNGKVVETIDGAESLSRVKEKIDNALK